MFKQALPLAALLALAACGNSTNPVNGVEDTDDDTVVEETVEDDGIPEVLRQDVSSIGFDPGDPDDPTDDVLTIEGVSLDDSPFSARYTRNTNLDVDGYQAYVSQDDRLSRMYVAVAATSADGSVQAGSVSDGGQFNEFFSGNFYERLVPLTRPSTTDDDGQVSYAGTYAGVTNLDDIGQAERLPLEPGDPDEAQPSQPRQTSGKVFVNVDFANDVVSGTIYDREFTDGKPMASLSLKAGALDENGEFLGEIEFSGRPADGKQGDYGGILGGTNASALAGVIHLDNVFVGEVNDPLDSNFDKEVGSFVIPRCGTDTAPDICDGLSDVSE